MNEEEQLKLQYFDALLDHIRELQKCSDALDAPVVNEETTAAHWDAFWWALDDLVEGAAHYEWLLNGGDHCEHRKIIEALRTRMPTTASA